MSDRSNILLYGTPASRILDRDPDPRLDNSVLEFPMTEPDGLVVSVRLQGEVVLSAYGEQVFMAPLAAGDRALVAAALARTLSVSLAGLASVLSEPDAPTPAA